VDVAVHAAADHAEAAAAVVAADQVQIRLVELVLVLRIDDEVRKIERPPDHRLASVQPLPGLAAVVGTIEAVLRRFSLDKGVDDIGF
jgi:hypothetical protein